MAALHFVYYSLLSLALLVFTLNKLLFRKTSSLNLPPSPPTIPIIGNLHHLKSPFHRSFHALSQTYGHIFSLWIGSQLVVVVSSQTLAQQCFTKYDIVLANRARNLVGKHLFYDCTSLGCSSYGDHWRNLRRIATTEILSTHRINSFAETRKDETLRVIKNLVEQTCTEFTRVKLRPWLSKISFNSMMRMISGKRYYGDDDSGNDVADTEEAMKFRETIAEILSLIGASKVVDFFPLLRWFDFDGLEKRLKRVNKSADKFLQGLIDEHRNGEHNKKTMIGNLLTQQKLQPQYYSDIIIKGLIQDMLIGGTDTTAVTMEWALAALLNHPGIFKKAMNELDTMVGSDRLIDESDIPNLPYLQNIIYETLRLYTPGPLLLPHVSSDECNIEGFTIPRGTIVLTSAWTIHRDPKIWGDDAECFNPERFEKDGEANKLLAFGLGRRACPGLGLAYRTMGLTLGLLIQCFEWKTLVENEEIDMREDEGAATPKLIPLEAMCKARPIGSRIKI
ncbi:isoflavone 3'-hydroxylase-like [Arachis stenosperma]|uniref:isoflavone 3'-hydroxylase-like n=1 Tax=Arachis stenosperma TaxID=217475 RepID=UPI0025AD4A04|nr:isoflavone 3'-hydroxylase-like [Arachis stenosperma]